MGNTVSYKKSEIYKIFTQRLASNPKGETIKFVDPKKNDLYFFISYKNENGKLIAAFSTSDMTTLGKGIYIKSANNNLKLSLLDEDFIYFSFNIKLELDPIPYTEELYQLKGKIIYKDKKYNTTAENFQVKKVGDVFLPIV